MYKPASFAYPLRDYKETYKKWIENIPNENIRKFIKIQMLCGFRGGEILNSYLFLTDKLYIRSIATKSQHTITISNHGTEHSRYLGHEQLKNLLNLKVWKMSECRNIFDLDIGDLYDFYNENTYEEPKYFVGDILGYETLSPIYKFLEKEELPISFKGSELEDAFKDEKRVGIHFFRKLYACELYRQTGNDLLKTKELMKWKKLDVLTYYIKDY